MNIKTLIVGHGLAGAVLAQKLAQRGIQTKVIEGDLPHSASAVSAGLINPFIGPKLNTPIDFADCMGETQNFFNKIENNSSQKFLEPINLLRVFISEKQQAKWLKLAKKYKGNFLDKTYCSKLGIKGEFGLGETRAWILKTDNFIKYSRNLLISKNLYQIEIFDPARWKGYQVIFCDGYRAAQNPWFKFLPFAPAKGEVLSVKSPQNIHTSNGSWHLMEKPGRAKIGTTWNHENIEVGPTQEARKSILKNLRYLTDSTDFCVTKHHAGVRSGTKDRQPILGRHPNKTNFYIFNGFGSRGCTTIAKCAEEFVNFFLNQAQLPPTKDLLRFL